MLANVQIEPWRKVWREGAAPLLSTPSLEALRKALVEDDVRLLQGVTTQPPPLQCMQDWPVEGACLLGYCGWIGDGLITVAEVEEFFANTCGGIDHRIGEPGGCRWLLNRFDDWPRDVMRKNLLEEVQLELGKRLLAADDLLERIA